MTGNEALRSATARLAAAGVPDAARDARLLLAHALAIGPERLILQLSEPLSEAAVAAFDAGVAAREARQPLSQITGSRLFWGLSFRVTPDVLDPRPETETLVAAALDGPMSRVLDLGTGSGAILLTLLAEHPSASGLGTDLSQAALDVARENARRLGVAERAEFRISDWLEDVGDSFDLVLSNPPYIAEAEMEALSPEVRDWEPRQALTPGAEGLEAYRAILGRIGRVLRPGGRLLLEIGATQGMAVARLCEAAGLREVRLLPDMDGRDRVVSALAPPAGRGGGNQPQPARKAVS
jgi:release factor glutamine methyltransferase